MEETRSSNILAARCKLFVVKAGRYLLIYLFAIAMLSYFRNEFGSRLTFEGITEGDVAFSRILYHEYFDGRMIFPPSGLYVFGFNGCSYWKKIEDFEDFNEVFLRMYDDLLQKLHILQSSHEVPWEKLKILHEQIEKLRDQVFQREIVLKLKTFLSIDEPTWNNDSMLLQFENALFNFHTKCFVVPHPDLKINSSCGIYFDRNIVFDTSFSNYSPELLLAINTIKEFIVSGWDFVLIENTHVNEIQSKLNKFHNLNLLFSTPLYRHAFCMLMIWHLDEFYESVCDGTFKRFIFKYKSLLKTSSATELYPQPEI